MIAIKQSDYIEKCIDVDLISCIRNNTPKENLIFFLFFFNIKREKTNLLHYEH